MNTSLFSEKQRFTQWWIFLILLFPAGSMAYGLYTQLMLHEQFGKQPMSNEMMLLVFFLSLLLPLSFFLFQLQTEIDKDSVRVRFFPFHLKWRTYSWTEISKAYTREYSPIGEFGGWGLRGWGNNRALNVSGKKGLQLEFKNGKKLLIGTQQIEKINAILTQLGKSSI